MKKGKQTALTSTTRVQP